MVDFDQTKKYVAERRLVNQEHTSQEAYDYWIKSGECFRDMCEYQNKAEPYPIGYWNYANKFKNQDIFDSIPNLDSIKKSHLREAYKYLVKCQEYRDKAIEAESNQSVDWAREAAKYEALELEEDADWLEDCAKNRFTTLVPKTERKQSVAKAKVIRKMAEQIKKTESTTTKEIESTCIELVEQMGRQLEALDNPSSVTESRLCQGKFYEKVPVNAITDTVYTSGVTGTDFWEITETRLNGGKSFPKGHIELQISDRFDFTNFTEITYQAKEVIAQHFGEETLKLHYALTAIAFRKEAPWDDEITVSLSKLLADFGTEDEKNRYISKSSRGESGQIVCYVPKEERLKRLAHQARLLKRIEVRVPEWRASKKRTFTIEMSNLWDIFSINEVTQLLTEGGNKIIDIEIVYRPGIWFRKFAGNKQLREFGYITSEALKLDPVQDRTALRLAYFALCVLGQHKSDRIQVETLLKRIGYGSEVEAAKIDRHAARNLERSFKRGIKTLENFQYPYYFEFDSDTPEWARSGSKLNKPAGWFEAWLELSGTIHQPDSLPDLKDASARLEKPSKRLCALKPSDASDPVAFGQQMRKTREERAESLTAVAEMLDISKTQLSQIENGCYPATINSKVKAKIIDYLRLSV